MPLMLKVAIFSGQLLPGGNALRRAKVALGPQSAAGARPAKIRDRRVLCLPGTQVASGAFGRAVSVNVVAAWLS